MTKHPQKKFETPVNIQAELAVLGCIVSDGNETLKRVGHILSERDFYEESHRALFRCARKLYESGIEPDLLTLHDSLKQAGWDEAVGGSAWLVELTNAMPSVENVVNYARLVAQYANARRILSASRDIARMTQEDISVSELVVKAEERLKGVTRDAMQSESRLEIVDLQPVMDHVKEHREPEGTIKGLSTGIQKIDKMTQGFVPGELMIVSGQTSHGKTQLSNNIMLNVARNGHKVMFITMEMTKQETADRFSLMLQGEALGEGKIFLNARSDLSYVDVTKLIEKSKEHGCDLVVIDHLHYFSRSIENSTQEVSKIVKEFKTAAVQYEIPIILICHVRKMEPKKHPTIDDLRDSSLIAQDADMVLIVWRDQRPDSPKPNEMEVVLWKNRNRQKKHRREFLYADGLNLKEVDTSEPGVADDIARVTGDKETVIEIGGSLDAADTTLAGW